MIDLGKYTDKHGNSVTYDAIVELLRTDLDYACVGTDDAGGWAVRTLWLGPTVLDEDGMRFGTALLSSPSISGRRSYWVLEVQRYPDLAAAEAGHARIVAWLNTGPLPLISQHAIDTLFEESTA